jgi:hypothetical protein
MRINEKEIPKNLQSTTGGAVTKEWKERKTVSQENKNHPTEHH